MKYKYTETELKKILSSMIILVDSREQKNNHITDWFTKKSTPFEVKALNTGDYSFYIPANPELSIHRNTYYDNEICIERKGTLDELINNFSERNRIEDEFTRASNIGLKIHLLIEDSSYKDIYEGNYQSKYNSKSAVGSLHSMTDRYNLNFVFLDKEYTAKYIFCCFYYFLRNKLK